MPVITFLPTQSPINVELGVSLLDAATAAGVTLTAPCGGEGACGQCRVKVASGAVERLASGCLSPEEWGEGWVLACSSRVTGDATILVPEEADGADGRIVIEGATRASASPFHPALPEPLTVKRLIKVEAPSSDNSFSDLDRLIRAIRASGAAGSGEPVKPANVTCGLTVLRDLAASLRAHEHEVTVTLRPGVMDMRLDGTTAEVIRIEPGDTTRRAFGVAIDIGTTTCAVHLVDLTDDHLLGSDAEYNGQIVRGADIISRINYAQRPERREELRRLVLENLEHLIVGLCRAHGIDPAEIGQAAVAGNTTMIHLFLGLDPQYIRLDPYTPTVNRPPLLRGAEASLPIHPEAVVMIAPGVGSYVGGDITAGLLQTALAAAGEEVRLFLDIGTNGEVVIGNGEWLMGCAASAGPAFEGSGVRCGMRAARGAIERVRVNRLTGRAEISVIGGDSPKGICGSGMIDLLAELFAAGLLDPSGKLNPAKGHGLIRPCASSGRVLEYVIVAGEASDTGEPIVIDEQDIQNLLRTKASIYSACSLMLKSVGLDFDAVTQVCVAGGFGRFLDLKKAIFIGMLPDLPLDRFVYLGNSALAGAHAMLVSQAARNKAIELADRLTYLELNVDPSYMNEYMAALFLPHTDLDRFPTVKEYLSDE